ncbi:MAG: hypothetical protein M0030_01060 [Actinomycetota bacterium]|nr:hypothetical protein [Actinomycetota bacterium]
MIAIATVDRAGFEAALATAREEGAVAAYPGLAAPLDGALRGKIAEVWESIENALRDAFMHGTEYARQAMDKAVSSADALIRSAGSRAKDVHQALLSKVQAYLSRFVDAALAQVRPAIEVGGGRLELDGLEVSQSISLAGSIKASLIELVTLTADGNLTVTARYRTRVS